MIPLTQIHGSPDPGSMHLHIPHTASRDTALRVCCTTPWACTCMLLRGIPGLLWSIHHRRISPPGISSSGCLPGHDPTHQDPRISGSLDLYTPHLHELRSWCAACVYQHAWAQRTRTPYSTYRASGVTPDPMPHTFGPRCRSRDLPSGVIPGSMDPGISPLRYIAFALGLGLRPLGLLLCLTSGPLVLRSNPRASSCSGSLWDHRPMAIPFWALPVMLRSSIRMYPRSSPRIISRCPDEDML
jgi:hypothetical protein